MKNYQKICLVALVLVLCRTFVFADSVRLKNGEKMKGIIVEEYVDRIIISTYEGEKTMLKDEISRIVYNLPEQNLIALGDSYMARKMYKRAYFYYEKASKVNPEYKPARDKLNYVKGYLFREAAQEKVKDVERKQEIEDRLKTDADVQKEDYKRELEEELGIGLVESGKDLRITKVVKGSPAEVAGIKENDLLDSVWGRLTGYMSVKDVAIVLLQEIPSEINICIQRDIALDKGSGRPAGYRNIIGGKLAMLFDGLTVRDLKQNGPGGMAGLEKGDLIVRINGVATRYMPIKEAIKKIEDKNNESVEFTVKRDLTIWRK